MNDLRTISVENLMITAKKPRELLKGVYLLRKAENRKFSLQYLCRKAKVPSKGYLSDVMSGRRNLHPRFANGLAEALGLGGIEKKIFVYTVQRDAEPSPARNENLEKRILSLKSQLKLGIKTIPAEAASPLLFTRVFCSLGFFSSPPTRQQLIELFFEESEGVVIDTIDLLLKSKAIVEKDGKISLSGAEVMFEGASKMESSLRHLSQSVEFARTQIPDWFPKRDESYFESSLVSVKKSKFMEALPKIKDFFDSIQSELEEPTDANELVHFNIQIFPDRLSLKNSSGS